MSDRRILGPPDRPTGATPGEHGAGLAAPLESFDSQVWARIHDYLSRNPGGSERLVPLLHLAQETLGYLPAAVQEHIAERIGLPLVQVHGVVSFYNYFNTRPRGRYQLKVCMGTACFVRRARELTETIRNLLGVETGSATEDKLFGLEEVRCVGACGVAPVMMVNEETHGSLDPGEIRRLVLGLQARARREKRLESTRDSDE